ncbi:hypothetical protein CDO30_20095 (plasmid) [Sinorhizobium meliloti]|nr:hypothetical protein CDO30_20095 [Sinorhizobium meliloti]RVL23873.1 hypothetical protein CN147_18860 [Sinorhizobium meliloti]RVL43981.1 hypothetical protein CN146_16520 [Sinorhizobium meliloti]RVL81292.1 hypothetical protein CN140_17845 [Sinorhizobium meliloti]RVN17973.1 hypothetical protein CN115_08430 [Sinorhizobium meliloti]
MPARFSQLRAKLGLAPEALSRASSALRHGVTSFGESRPRRLRLADLLTTSREDGGAMCRASEHRTTSLGAYRQRSAEALICSLGR